jgi:hypothetical protein
MLPIRLLAFLIMLYFISCVPNGALADEEEFIPLREHRYRIGREQLQGA